MFADLLVPSHDDMTKLHLFNPEHDIALAANLAHFTAPLAGRQLRADLAYLPALWADEDDYVLVEQVEQAQRGYESLRQLMNRPQAQFIHRHELSRLPIGQVEPWGWDAAVATDLHRWGISEDIMPSASLLEHYRQLSHRRTSARLLPSLRMEGTVGEAVECTTIEQVYACEQRWKKIVIKAPWSSSGRGVRFAIQEGWIRNIIERQGSVMVEPLYDREKDFGMEFEVDADGQVRYLGLSLFHTKNGAYIGNILATEEVKREMMARYVSLDLLDRVKQGIIEHAPLADYQGCFGVDMMIIKGEGESLLHPCVELNLRRTMGHVALSLTPRNEDEVKVMRIDFTDHYELHIDMLNR